jgi:hypothetical protein
MVSNPALKKTNPAMIAGALLMCALNNRHKHQQKFVYGDHSYFKKRKA